MEKLNNLYEQIINLPAEDKMRLIDLLLLELEITDQGLIEIWCEESEKRWQAYKAGKQKTISHDSILDRYKNFYSSFPKQTP